METAGLPPHTPPWRLREQVFAGKWNGRNPVPDSKICRKSLARVEENPGRKNMAGWSREKCRYSPPPTPLRRDAGDGPSRWVGVPGERSTNRCSFGPCWKSCRCKSRAVFSLKRIYLESPSGTNLSVVGLPVLHRTSRNQRVTK
ncbi:hypothetical protein PAL_GLEAN10004064 [Pteropus alecto]|uniref:Uncharacterized protein n=1 Tax=Pteropus alecto TaxID=9402 RepID=L5KPF7_PTEAL|nr:hypothetical protein PAL_GLEAN10004064 [Pteropus alecto]